MWTGPERALRLARDSTHRANDETNRIIIVTCKRQSNEKEILRQMDSKTRSERSVLRKWFVIIRLFIPYFMITILKIAMLFLKRKIHDFCQRELKKLYEIHGDNTTPQQHTDPAFVTYTKGEDQVPDMGCPQKNNRN